VTSLLMTMALDMAVTMEMESFTNLPEDVAAEVAQLVNHSLMETVSTTLASTLVTILASQQGLQTEVEGVGAEGVHVTLSRLKPRMRSQKLLILC